MKAIYLIALLQILGACRRKAENDQGDQIAPRIFYWPDGGCIQHTEIAGLDK